MISEQVTKDISPLHSARNRKSQVKGLNAKEMNSDRRNSRLRDARSPVTSCLSTRAALQHEINTLQLRNGNICSVRAASLSKIPSRVVSLFRSSENRRYSLRSEFSGEQLVPFPSKGVLPRCLPTQFEYFVDFTRRANLFKANERNRLFFRLCSRSSRLARTLESHP